MQISELITKKRIIYASLTLGGVALLIWMFIPGKTPVEIASVQKGLYEQTVQEDGNTRIKERHVVLSPYSGVLKRVQKHAGDSVRRGETVAIIQWDWTKPIASPANGSILKILREDEGPIEIGQPIMEIGDTHSIEIVIEVLSADAVNIQRGNPVHILRWGGPDSLEGQVRTVEPQAFAKVSALGVEERRVRIIADIVTEKEKWKSLGDNFRLECKIVTYQNPDALKVNSGALFREGDSWSVFRVIKGRARKTPVEIERRGPLETMLKSGLAPGDEVILYPGESVEEGQRVRPE
ncbi:MAG: HlyD family efflux transporter periplasmic adaptor subunit [Spirochaetia bacterium]|nr:HlyD family efflux transporter periplasmic adaptor subunit [Spirochaetia bacterium]